MRDVVCLYKLFRTAVTKQLVGVNSGAVDRHYGARYWQYCSCMSSDDRNESLSPRESTDTDASFCAARMNAEKVHSEGSTPSSCYCCYAARLKQRPSPTRALLLRSYYYRVFCHAYLYSINAQTSVAPMHSDSGSI